MSYNTPLAIRYPRGQEELDFDFDDCDFTVFSEYGDIAIITYGLISSNAVKAQKMLKDNRVNADVIKLNKIYPLSDELCFQLKKYKKVYFFEEGIRKGGVSEHLISKAGLREYKIFAIDNTFVPCASIGSARRKLSLDAESMYKIIKGEN